MEIQSTDAKPSYDRDRQYAEEAVERARLCHSEPGKLSPFVAAIAVDKDGQKLGVAHRGEQAPGDHAEYTLLEKKLGSSAYSLAGTTVYTTLEPCICRSEGKIPCAERLIARKVGRVVIGMLDPNPNICGRGARMLRAHGIKVDYFPDDLIDKLEDMNRGFTRHVLEEHEEKLARAEQSPLKFKKEFYEEVIAKIHAEAPIVTPQPVGARWHEETKNGKEEEHRLYYESYSNLYVNLAKRAYGKSDIRSICQNAWYYVVAADCSKEAGNVSDAGMYYHFAANLFRHAQFYDRAMEYYEKSGLRYLGIVEQMNKDKPLLPFNNTKIKEAIRSFQRALGVARICGDLDTEEEMWNFLIQLKPEYKNFRHTHPDNDRAFQSDGIIDVGIDHVCGPNDKNEQISEMISSTMCIRCMSRTGRDFIERHGDKIFKLLSERPSLKVQIIICSENAAKDPLFERVCPGSRPYEDIVSFYTQYLQKHDLRETDLKGRIKVKEYKYILTGNVLITDNNFKFIPYLPEKHSKNSIAIIGHKSKKGENGDGLYETLDDIFKRLWEDKYVDKVEEISIDTMRTRIRHL